MQNSHIMLLADFSRNCLSKWYHETAVKAEASVSLEEAKENIYGMLYSDWKAKYQLSAPPETLAQFAVQQARREN